MRDLETITTALAAAETGHLVMATLHTPSACGTVERIVSSFEGSRQPQVIIQMASCLLGVIAQRLIPTVDKRDRVLATEVLLANGAVRAIIRENRLHQLPNAITSGRKEGMHSMEESLAELYRKGLITLDRALANANDPAVLRTMVGK
jgi:twitching motility protein PilT